MLPNSSPASLPAPPAPVFVSGPAEFEPFIRVPLAVLQRRDLLCNAKLLFGLIAALSYKEGYCWASNQYLADRLAVTPKHVSELIGLLEDRGLLQSQRHSERGNQRQLFIAACVRTPASEKVSGTAGRPSSPRPLPPVPAPPRAGDPLHLQPELLENLNPKESKSLSDSLSDSNSLGCVEANTSFPEQRPMREGAGEGLARASERIPPADRGDAAASPDGRAEGNGPSPKTSAKSPVGSRASQAPNTAFQAPNAAFREAHAWLRQRAGRPSLPCGTLELSDAEQAGAGERAKTDWSRLSAAEKAAFVTQAAQHLRRAGLPPPPCRAVEACAFHLWAAHAVSWRRLPERAGSLPTLTPRTSATSFQ